MKKWFSSLVKDIEMLGDKVYIYDPSGMLRDQNLKQQLMKKYNLHEFKDDASLFLFYSANKNNPIIIFSSNKVSSYFIDRNFKRKELLLSDVFPELDASMLSELDIRYFQTLHNDYCERKDQGLDIGSTQEFILKSIWNIDLSKLHSKTENFKIALAYIIDQRDLPKTIISDTSRMLSLDLKRVRNDNLEFLSWVKLQIKAYIEQKESGQYPCVQLSDPAIQFYLLKLSLIHNLELPIPDDLIFKEGWLSKFQKGPNQRIIETKISSMLEDYRNKLKELSQTEFDFNEIDSIITVSRLFSEIIYLLQTTDSNINNYINIESEYDSFDRLLRSKLINEKNNNYESLFYASQSDKPLTVDKILAYAKKKFNKAIALVVMDGMSFDEWFILREYLQDFKKTENGIFALLPTATAFSRTAIFSGKAPREFMNAKYEFNEEKEFLKAMVDLGFEENNVLFGHINLKKNVIKTSDGNREYGHLKGYDFLGLVCNIFDDISHEEVVVNTLKKNLYSNAKNHIFASSLKSLIKQLRDDGYHIILTSDHGNIFCVGNGIKVNKNLQVCKESIRCLFYDRATFAEQVTSRNPKRVFAYSYSMLPENLVLVFPLRNECFKNEGDLAITHGGISPEELIVPLVVLE